MPCAICQHDFGRGDHTTSIGEARAHVECAGDPLNVATCAYCAQLALHDDTGDWRKCSDGLCCPACAAEIEVEYATCPGESPLAQAVRALDALIREVSA